MPTALFIAPAAFPLGGVAAWLDYLLPGLEAHGWRCVLGLTQGRHHDVQQYLARHPWHEAIAIRNPTGSAEGRVRAVASTIEDVAPDLVVVVNVATAYEAVRRLRSTGARAPKVAMALHALQEDFLDDIATESDVLDAVICTNRLAVRAAAMRRGCDERVFYASYGVESPATARMAAHPDTSRILYSGRLDESQKRIIDLVRIARTLETRGVPFAIDIAGAGPDEGALRSQIATCGLDHRFRFLGDLDARALAAEYACHAALLITSEWETGPIVAWEAMSHCLPVVSSMYVGSGLEAGLANHSNCLLFPVGDVEAAADAIELLFTRGMRERLIAGGLELVQSRYNTRASVVLWDEALRGVLRSAELPRPRPGVTTPAAGRLDRWLGAKTGESVRRALHLQFTHADPGAEWPHSGSPGRPQRRFLETLRALDAVATT